MRHLMQRDEPAGIYRERESKMFISAVDTHLDIAPRKSEPQTIADTVMQLLVQAGHAVMRDQDEALRCIEKARTLARAWRNGENPPEIVPYRGGLAPWQLERVKEFVDENLTSTIRISELAKCVSLSDSYFFQAFRRSIGQSPHSYVTERRILRAQQMMVHTDQPLSQIALECGLADQPHLTRLFRCHVGTSPALWRKACCAQAR
jgi:AraC family transcriptional regulator